jgi:hypothetical protein
MNNIQIILFCLAISPLQANQPAPVNLASGHRGLAFEWIIPEDPKLPYDTVAFVCNLNSGFDGTYGFNDRAPETRVILKEKLTPENLKGFDPRFWNGWVSKRIYSFGENAAFSGRTLFRIEQGHIRIYPGRVPAEAKKTYGLTEGQTFLGAFDGRVFYWNASQPQAIEFRSGTQVYRFKLPKRVTEPLGMAKGEPKGDLALYAVAKPATFFHVAPRTLDWFILNFKEAERVR